MEADRSGSTSTDDRFPWIEGVPFRDSVQALSDVQAIWQCGAAAELLDSLRDQLLAQFQRMIEPDAALSSLARFVTASSDPDALLGLFQRDSEALPALMQVFGASQSLANRLIADPASFDLLMTSDDQPFDREALITELSGELSGIDRTNRAAVAIRRFVSRHLVRIAYSEFVRGRTPEKTGRELAHVADAVIESSRQFVMQRLTERRDLPRLADGSVPEVTIIGLGELGGEEMGYDASMPLVFLYDQIDRNNPWHRDFYHSLVADIVSLLSPDSPQSLGLEIDLRNGPKYDVGVNICSFRDAIRIYETSGRTWHRMRFVKARVVGGSRELGEAFLKRLEPWVYQRFLGRTDLAEIRTLRHKLERRAEQKGVVGHDVSRDPGGRTDVEMTIQFLQLLHGGDLASVRVGNTNAAIVALERAGCLTHQEATLLSDNYARLCRLQHQMSVMFDGRDGRLPDDPDQRGRLAWQLGVRIEDGTAGDTERFDSLLQDTFRVNRKMINHLMLDAPHEETAVAVETELLLDPDPDPDVVRETMAKYGLTDSKRAMEDLAALSTETVPFLSPHRCRHFFAALAPELLAQVARTPDPHSALASLVRVTDSLVPKRRCGSCWRPIARCWSWSCGWARPLLT